MKHSSYKLTLLIALLPAVSLWSCSEDVETGTETVVADEIPAAIRTDFTQSYPGASDVEWTVSDGYAVASFITTAARSASPHHSSVWYGMDDNHKKMHSTPVAFAELPSAVSEAFKASEYGVLTPCEPAYAITRYHAGNPDSIYLVKAKGALEGTVSTAVRLYYTAEGALVKLASEIVYDESFDGDDDINKFKEWLPQTPADFVKAYIDSMYPGARYLYIHEGPDATRVKILVGHTVRTIVFDAEGAWISTTAEIDRDNIPADILAAFRSSSYAGWHIKKVVEYSTAAEGRYYMLSLENGKEKAQLRIEADGTVAGEPQTPAVPDEPENPSDGNKYLAKSEIEGFILAKYPGATIRKYDFDDDDAEVEIVCDGHKIKVEFDLHPQGYLWTRSECDFDIRNTSALPAPVVKTLSDKYSAYRLEYLSFTESAGEQPFYEAGLKSARSKESLKVKMDEQGTVIAEYGKH